MLQTIMLSDVQTESDNNTFTSAKLEFAIKISSEWQKLGSMIVDQNGSEVSDNSDTIAPHRSYYGISSITRTLHWFHVSSVTAIYQKSPNLPTCLCSTRRCLDVGQCEYNVILSIILSSESPDSIPHLPFIANLLFTVLFVVIACIATVGNTLTVVVIYKVSPPLHSILPSSSRPVSSTATRTISSLLLLSPISV